MAASARRAPLPDRARGGRTAAPRAPSSRATRPGACSAGTPGAPSSAGAEGLLGGRLLVAERARQLAQHGVRDHHRRELAAREHVAADRDRLGAEVLDDPLVEALVAAAQQRQRRLRGELVGERVVEQPAARGRARSRGGARAASTGSRRSVRAAPPRRRRRAAPSPPRRRTATSSTLPAFSGVVAAVVDALDRVAVRERVGDVALGAEPVEPVREEREDVDDHASPRKPRSTSIRRAADVDRADASPNSGTSSSAPSARSTSSTSHGRQREHLAHAADLAVAVDDRAALELVGPPLAGLELGRVLQRDPSGRAAQRLGGLARRRSRRARIGCSSVPARRTISPTVGGASPERQQPRARAEDVEGAVEAVGAPDAPRLEEPLHGATRRCRRGRGGCPSPRRP